MSRQLDWNRLLTLPPPWAHLVCCSHREIDSILHYRVPENTGVVARILRGKRCSTKQTLFQEWAAALQFPYYFGENWDAFDECITDLEWLPARGYVFAITLTDLLLRDADEDLQVLVRLLEKASAEWATPQENDQESQRQAVPFHILFHCEPENEVITCNRLERAGVRLTGQTI